ncbi:MAG: hypothetical protein L7F78_23020 [Syntrophales bacterium LBB04]|nr:hypothetical protein [Syntrophales bacterium LBB04]
MTKVFFKTKSKTGYDQSHKKTIAHPVESSDIWVAVGKNEQSENTVDKEDPEFQTLTVRIEVPNQKKETKIRK